MQEKRALDIRITSKQVDDDVKVINDSSVREVIFVNIEGDEVDYEP